MCLKITIISVILVISYKEGENRDDSHDGRYLGKAQSLSQRAMQETRRFTNVARSPLSRSGPWPCVSRLGSKACMVISNHLLEPTWSTLHHLCWTGFGHLTAHHRGDLGSQQFDGLSHFGKGHAPDVDLPDEALVSKQFVLVEQFVDDLLRASHEERILSPRFPLVLRATERHMTDPVPSQRFEVVGPIGI